MKDILEERITMNKLKLVKDIGGMIISGGVGMIVANAVTATTPGVIGTVKKVCITIGSFVLGAMVGDYAAKYAEGKFDDVVKEIKQAVTEAQEVVEEVKKTEEI
jgi:hypothetical protein